MDNFDKKGKISFRIWTNCNEKITDFIDDPVFLSPDVQLALYQESDCRSQTPKEHDIYLVYSFTDFSNQIFLRIFKNNGTKIEKFKPFSMDYKLSQIQVHVLEDEGQKFIYYVGLKENHSEVT